MRREAAEAVLARYGSEASVGGESVRAVISPLRFDSAQEAEKGLYYRYTGPASHSLAPGDRVETPGRSYAVLRAESKGIGGEALFVRAVLRALGSETGPKIRLLSPDGSVLATARSYEAKEKRGAEPVFSQGEGAAAEIVPGTVVYELALSDVETEQGRRNGDFGEFSVEIRQGAKKMVYAGCRVNTGTETGGASGSARRSLQILACAKTEEVL